MSNHAEGDGSWWGNNWKWAVPVGCLGCLGLPVAFVVFLVFVLFAAIRNSDAYVQGLELAENSPEVRDALGEPFEAGWFTTGSVNTHNSSGSAKLSVPLSGPEGNGMLFIEATMQDGEWSLDLADFRDSEGGERFDLLD